LREKGRKGEREKGRKGEREKGRKGEREKGDNLVDFLGTTRRGFPRELWGALTQHV